MRLVPQILALVASVIVATSALAQTSPGFSVRATGGGAFSDLGPGGGAGLEGELWLKPTRTGLLGLGARLFLEWEGEEPNRGWRRDRSAEIYAAFGGDLGRVRLFIGPALGGSLIYQEDFWDNTTYQGPFVRISVLGGAIAHFSGFAVSLIARGTFIAAQGATDATQLTQPLFPGGWVWSLDLGLGYVTPF